MPLDQTAPGAIPVLPPIHSDGPHADVQVALTEIHLRELAEMRAIGMRHLRDTEVEHKRDGRDPPSRAAQWKAYDALSKSVRQIMALEQEIIGLRDRRIRFVKTEWLKQKAGAVRASVERSVEKAKPEIDRRGRERLLADLFVDYRKFADGNIRDIIEGICKTLGITADLSLWDEPQPDADITLREGFKWVVPANGEKPYTVVTSPSGISTRLPFDSQHIERRANAPPAG